MLYTNISKSVAKA